MLYHSTHGRQNFREPAVQMTRIMIRKPLLFPSGIGEYASNVSVTSFSASAIHNVPVINTSFPGEGTCSILSIYGYLIHTRGEKLDEIVVIGLLYLVLYSSQYLGGFFCIL